MTTATRRRGATVFLVVFVTALLPLAGEALAALYNSYNSNILGSLSFVLDDPSYPNACPWGDTCAVYDGQASSVAKFDERLSCSRDAYVGASTTSAVTMYVPLYARDRHPDQYWDIYTTIYSYSTTDPNPTDTCNLAGAEVRSTMFHEWSNWVQPGDTITARRVYRVDAPKHSNCGTSQWCSTKFVVSTDMTVRNYYTNAGVDNLYSSIDSCLGFVYFQ